MEVDQTQEPIRVFVGCDRSQLIAFKVLEHSIQRRTNRPVICKQIDNTMMPETTSPADTPYTNFSFARFGIPSFTDYQGKGIYMDADMVVMTDIATLWDTPFNGAKVLLLEQANEKFKKRQSKNSPRQTAVMLLDCSRLTDWRPEMLIGNLGKAYNRDTLMRLQFMPNSDVREILPITWNCMDWYEEGLTKNIHYTRIETQPWVSPLHPYSNVWMDELKRMLADGSMDEAFIRKEVAIGFVRPSLLVELGFESWPVGKPQTSGTLLGVDEQAGYKMHDEMIVRETKRHKRLGPKLWRKFKKKFLSAA